MSSDIVSIIFRTVAFALGGLAVTTALLYVRLCFKKPFDALGFIHQQISVDKGIGYYIECPLGRVHFTDSSLKAPYHRYQRWAINLNVGLAWIGFSIPIFFTICGFLLPFKIRIFDGSDEGMLFVGVTLAILGSYYILKTFEQVADKLAHYERLHGAAQEQQNALSPNPDHFQCTDIFTKE